MGVISVSLEDSANGNATLKMQARASIGKAHRASLKGRERSRVKRNFTKAQAKPSVDTYAFAARDVTAPAKAGMGIPHRGINMMP